MGWVGGRLTERSDGPEKYGRLKWGKLRLGVCKQQGDRRFARNIKKMKLQMNWDWEGDRETKSILLNGRVWM